MRITFLADFIGFFIGYIGELLNYIILIVFRSANPDFSQYKAMLLTEGHTVVNLGIIHKPTDLTLGRIMAQWTFRAGYFPVLHGFFAGIELPGYIFIIGWIGYVNLFTLALGILIHVQG